MPIIPEHEAYARQLELLTATERSVTRPRPPWQAPGLTSIRSVSQVVDRRRSMRSFDDRPVTMDELEQILRPTRHADENLSTVVITRPASAAPKAVTYLVEADGALVERPDLALSGVDGDYSRPPVVLIILGDLHKVSEAEGANGYSRLMVQAGALGHAMWLTAASLGLGGYPFGRSHSAVSAVVRRRGGLRQLFTVAIGHCAEAA